LIGHIGLDETKRIKGRGVRRIVVIIVAFVPVGVVADALDNQPVRQGMTAHDQAEGRALHVNRDRPTYRSPHVLERMISPHGIARGHRLDVTCYLSSLALFRWRWRAY